jgi:hypothetical protein
MNGYRSRWRGIVGCTLGPFYVRERTTGTIEYEAGWAPRAGLGVLDKRKSHLTFM